MFELSEQGLTSIKQWENLELQMYLDPVGLPTIGYGHLLTRSELSSGKVLIGGVNVRWCNGLTEEQVNLLLAQDTEEAQAAIRKYIDPEIMQNMNQAQYDALVSFVFNVGSGAFRSSTLLKRIRAGDFDDVPAQLSRWIFAKGERLSGLVNRREHEADIWENGYQIA